MLQSLLNKPKINLPNRESQIHFPRCQFQVVPRCLMSTLGLEEKVVFKERTEHLLNIQNFTQRFRNQMKDIRYFNNTYKCFALRIFVHHFVKCANLFIMLRRIQVKFSSALQERTEVKSNLTFIYLKFLESQFCQSR